MLFRSLRKREKWLLAELGLALVVLGLLCSIMIPRFLAVQNINTPENFPDPAFRRAVQRLMRVEEGERFSAVQARKMTGELVCGGMRITDFSGLQFFSSITGIYCQNNNITSLDLSGNHNLEMLCCHSNKLKNLDLSNTPFLRIVKCNGNLLTSLDLSNNPHLELLFCHENSLTALDITQNPVLEELLISKNPLTSLDISKNPKLRKLIVKNCQLKSISLSNNPAMEELYVDDNKLIALDVSGNTLLRVLDCSTNRIQSLDLSANNALQVVHCYQNPFKILNMQNILDLRELVYSDTLITIYVTQKASFNKVYHPEGTKIVRERCNWSASFRKK